MARELLSIVNEVSEFSSGYIEKIARILHDAGIPRDLLKDWTGCDALSDPEVTP